MARPTRSRPQPGPARRDLTGTEWTLEVGPFAHGGHCVARHEGLVVFVRHALPGEQVRARVTEGREGDRYVRADAIEVIAASPHRVVPLCRYAAERSCGGCDLQHVELGHQRELKAAVVREQLHRLAGLDLSVSVGAVPGDEQGLRWRTRVEFAVDPSGRAGLRPFRSRAVTPLHDCLIATQAVVDSGVLDTEWSGCASVEVVDAAHPAEPVSVPVARAGSPDGRDQARPPSAASGSAGGLVGERVVLRDDDGESRWEGEYVVAARGFWQVHPGAASTFLSRVESLLEVRPGDRVLDLFAGSGLFTMRLGELVGENGAVLGVEGDERAVVNGIDNCAHLPTVQWRANRVDRELRSLVRQGITADLVVLDPPRTGAGREVIELVAAMGPRRVVYVACDPAALARDLRTATEHGYRVQHVEAWDAFPMTHHVETIAVLERTANG